MIRFIRAVLVAAAGGIAVGLSQYLAARLGEPLAIVVSAIAAAAVQQALEWCILDLPLRFNWIRRRLDDRAHFEGAWLINVDPLSPAPIAYGTILYQTTGNKYSYAGRRCYPNGEQFSRFETLDLVAGATANQLRYSWEGRTIGSNSSLLGGAGVLSFERDGNQECTRGNDFWFEENGESVVKLSCTMTKVSKARLKEVLGRPKIRKPEDVALLIRAHVADAAGVTQGPKGGPEGD